MNNKERPTEQEIANALEIAMWEYERPAYEPLPPLDYVHKDDEIPVEASRVFWFLSGAGIVAMVVLVGWLIMGR